LFQWLDEKKRVKLLSEKGKCFAIIINGRQFSLIRHQAIICGVAIDRSSRTTQRDPPEADKSSMRRPESNGFLVTSVLPKPPDLNEDTQI
jgi:hypothetical protein